MGVCVFRVIYFMTIYLFVNINCASTNPQTIRIRGPNPSFTTYFAELTKKLVIIFEGFLRNNSLMCSPKPSTDILFTRYDSVSGYHVLDIPLVSSFMSALWECNDENGIQFSFEIRVQRQVNVTISEEPVKFSMKNYSSDGYDGIYEYLCEEGYSIDLKCMNMYENGEMRLRYYNKEGILLVDTRDNGHRNISLNFRMLIRNQNLSHTYSDCTYITPTGRRQQEYTYRTVFIVSKSILNKNNDLTVTINGVKLRPTSINLDAVDKYTYKYTSEQLLNITCAREKPLIRTNIYGKIVNNSYSGLVIQDTVNQTSKISGLIETRKLRGMVYQCYSYAELSKTYKVEAEISFSLEIRQFPIVKGLPVQNVLYEYSTGHKEWIIHYQYADDDVLNLTCITVQGELPQWVYPENIPYTIRECDGLKNAHYINYLFLTNTELKNITCDSSISTHRVIIMLQKIPDVQAQIQQLNFNEKPFTTSHIIAAVAGICILIIASVLMCYWWRYRKTSIRVKISSKSFAKHSNCINQSSNPDENHEYTYIENVNKNVTEHQQGEMKTNSLYCKHSHDGLHTENKAVDGPVNPHYTEIANNLQDDTVKYSVPYEVIRKNDFQRENHYTEIVYGIKNERNPYAEPYTSKGLDRSYNNLEHLRKPSYSNLVANEIYSDR